MECGVWGVKCRVWSGKVWSVQWVKFRAWSVERECGV